MKPELTLIPKISIHPSRINFYYEPHWEPYKPARKNQINYVSAEQVIEELENQEIKTKYDHLLNSKRSAQGHLSEIAKRKLLRSLEYLLLITNKKQVSSSSAGRLYKFKIAFVTLSLASKQIHSDNEIKEKLLNQFLIELKKHYKVKNYIWRAEKQKNGNIHFHIIVDKFIPYNELRNRWNRIQEKLGYITRYREHQINYHKNGFKVREELLKTWPKRKQYEAYKRGVKCHWNNPNSTDIHSVKKIHNVKYYISKYISKNIEDFEKLNNSEKEKLLVEGRIWGASQNLSNIKGAQVVVSNEIEEELLKIQNSGKFKEITETYYNISFIAFDELKTIDCNLLWQIFAKYMLETFGWSYQYSTGFD